jgi:hypothetical protein
VGIRAAATRRTRRKSSRKWTRPNEVPVDSFGF